VDDETEIPADLLDPPSGSVPPPVETAEQTLPMGSLTFEDFEKLCMRLARLEGAPWRSRRYGTPGQKQYGIDIYSRMPSGRYTTYQFKRYEELEPSDFTKAVDEFLAGRWAARSDRFVFCTAASTARSQLQEAIESEHDRLADRRPPIAWEVWDADELSDRMRSHSDIVRLFFGPHWERRFFGHEELATLSADELAAVVRDAVASTRPPKWFPTTGHQRHYAHIWTTSLRKTPTASVA
jgi:hypothetical protein